MTTTKLAKVMGASYRPAAQFDVSLLNEKGTLDKARLTECGIAVLESVKSEAISGTVAITGLGMKAELSGAQLKTLPSYAAPDVAEAVASENPEAGIRGAVIGLSKLKHSRNGTGTAIADFVARASGLTDEESNRIRFAAVQGTFGPRLSARIDQMAEEIEQAEKAKQAETTTGPKVEAIDPPTDDTLTESELEAMTAPQS